MSVERCRKFHYLLLFATYSISFYIFVNVKFYVIPDDNPVILLVNQIMKRIEKVSDFSQLLSSEEGEFKRYTILYMTRLRDQSEKQKFCS